MVAIGSEVVVLSAGAFNLENTTAMNVLDFGAKNTGLVADAAANNLAIQAAFTALPANGGVLVFPAGDYYVTGLIFKDKVVTLSGDGGRAQDYSTGDFIRSSTRIRSATNAIIVDFTDGSGKAGANGIIGQHSTIRNIGVIGSGSGTSQHGIRFDQRGNHAWNVEVANCGGNGFQITDSVGTNLYNCLALRNKGHGYNLDFSAGTGVNCAITTTEFYGCVAEANTLDGWRVGPASTGVGWDSCITESNTGWGLKFVGGGGSATKRNIAYKLWDETNQRLDNGCGTTNASPTVTDAAITASDAGRPITGSGIPVGAFIGPAAGISAGVSFKLSNNPITQVDVNATATATVTLTLRGSVRFDDGNCTDNDINYYRYSSGVRSDAANGLHNLVSGPNVDLTGAAQRDILQVADIQSSGGLSSADADFLRGRNRDDTDNATLIMQSFISTYGITVAAATLSTALAVPQGVDAFCVPYDRGMTWRNQANNANIAGLHMGDIVANALTVDGASTGGVVLAKSGSRVGFYGTTPVIRDTGWTAATNTKTKTTFDTTTVTLPVLAAHVGAIIDVLINNGMISLA